VVLRTLARAEERPEGGTIGSSAGWSARDLGVTHGGLVSTVVAHEPARGTSTIEIA
jgi:hypothetical protein